LKKYEKRDKFQKKICRNGQFGKCLNKLNLNMLVNIATIGNRRQKQSLVFNSLFISFSYFRFLLMEKTRAPSRDCFWRRTVISHSVSNGIHKLSHEFYWKVGIKNHSEKVGSRLLDQTNSS
jgi:hypothetical protein